MINMNKALVVQFVVTYLSKLACQSLLVKACLSKLACQSLLVKACLSKLACQSLLVKACLFVKACLSKLACQSLLVKACLSKLACQSLHKILLQSIFFKSVCLSRSSQIIQQRSGAQPVCHPQDHLDCPNQIFGHSSWCCNFEFTTNQPTRPSWVSWSRFTVPI